jgi:hypothetical protein
MPPLVNVPGIKKKEIGLDQFYQNGVAASMEFVGMVDGVVGWRAGQKVEGIKTRFGYYFGAEFDHGEAGRGVGAFFCRMACGS